jgi:hypothetical protein
MTTIRSIMDPRARPPLAHWMPGSVAHHAFRASPGPVLTRGPSQRGPTPMPPDTVNVESVAERE